MPARLTGPAAADPAAYTLRIVQPAFTSPLTDVVIELEYLRRLQLSGDTPAPVFFQLKSIFHLLESLGSARIEGNHTTLADYIEARLDGAASSSDAIREIENIERAMDYLEAAVKPGDAITHHLVRELHALTVKDLVREGDRTPGAYRGANVQIAGATHTPPDVVHVQGLMDELLAYVNAPDLPKYDLLKTAVAHHRFAWVHPFGNGNGRVVRLFTYALLLKYGFNVSTGGRVLNPTAVFCNDRERYYAMLATADTGSDAGLEAWALYVLAGVRDELKKVDQLTRYAFLKEKILLPALAWSRERGFIDAIEERLLRMAIDKGLFKARDMDQVLPALTPRQRTYRLNKLLGAGMVKPIAPNTRTYCIQFAHSGLMRGVIRMLTEQGFTPELG